MERVVSGVAEEAVVDVEEVLAEEGDPFALHAAVVEAGFVAEGDDETAFEFAGSMGEGVGGFW